MRFFTNPDDNDNVYGFDPDDPGQDALIENAVSQKWIEVTGEWPPPHVPGPDEQHTAAIARGIAFSSQAAPQVDATYGVTDTDMSAIMMEAHFVTLYGEFTTGETILWPASDGTQREFSRMDIFVVFAREAARYVSQCRQVLQALNSGESASFPSNEVATE